MILSGIQAMLPALGLEWYEEYEELREKKKSSNVIVQPNDWSWATIAPQHNQDEINTMDILFR